MLKSKWSPLKATEVFDTYWKFAAERQEIFFNKFYNKTPPWTEDVILQEYKFTNVYRATDRVSQFLIKNVIYCGEQTPEEIFFRIMLFKTFNKIETWKELIKKINIISWREYNFGKYDKALKEIKAKQPIYSAAYIMPSGSRKLGHKFKHQNHLKLIEMMMQDKLVFKICEAKSLQSIYILLRNYPMIGDFLAYQYTIDINYSTLVNFSEMSFVVPGPGAKSGIQKCFSDKGGFSDVDIIKLVTDEQFNEFKRLGISFKDLWGRPLQLIDCQNLFCEVDKYSRIAHPNIKGNSNRSKIKQKYKRNIEKINYFFPPKWGLNEIIKNVGRGNIKNLHEK